MDIIENIKDTVYKTGRSAVKKTKDLAGIARLSAQIDETKNLIDDVYAEIGKKYCELYNKDTAGSEFAVSVATVENLTEQLHALKLEKLALKGKVQCESCKKECADDYLFCPHCGAKLPEAEAEEPKAAEDVFDDEDEEIDE